MGGHQPLGLRAGSDICARLALGMPWWWEICCPSWRPSVAVRKVMVAREEKDPQAPAGRLGPAKATNGPGSHDLYRGCGNRGASRRADLPKTIPRSSSA